MEHVRSSAWGGAGSRGSVKYNVTFTWLRRTFDDLALGAPIEIIVCHTRAYILHLLGGLLMADKLGARDHLRWLPRLSDFAYVDRLG